MAYFAQIDDDGTVINVISVSNADAPDPAPEHSEPLGQAFIASLGLEGNYLQTSYHGTFRKAFASIGGRYDSQADVFIAPQPFPSWTLDANHDWQPPTPYPSGAGPLEYAWDDASLTWVALSAI